MIFKFITLDLERRTDQFSNEDGYFFYLKSGALCSYLERFIHSLKIETQSYNQLTIKGFMKDGNSPYINSCNVLVVHLNLNLKEYKTILETKESELINEFYISFLQAGMELISSGFKLPKSEITEGIELFRKGGYINKWSYAVRRITGRGLSCNLECQVTLDAFSLNLVILKKGNEIKREPIIMDIPNPIIYLNHFGDLKTNKEGVIQVTNRSKNIIYSKNIDEILHGENNHNLLQANLTKNTPLST